ncbi:hypothetical protein STAS_26819 [Striga asiatica]|uniref:DUF1664 domain-containing protein n=1 Tax=Striga asiatica TaxID=4170 RepID=A0A5A7QYT9_STRAF|nr:hypothetical protein STAS_26819 [Striga asiatica]
MAMQAGIGLSRIILVLGAGYTGTILLKNGKLSDVLGELQSLVKGMEKSGETDGESGYSDAIAAQVRRLAMEVRQLASSREITVLNGNSGQSNLTSLIVPAASLGALGYGYMWWKGLSFSDLMYVTKRNMANAVSNLTKHLDHVSDALAAAKRHLTQRIENLDGKLDEQVEVSKLIRNEDGKLLSLEGKQELANAGVMYLCSIVNGRKVKMPEKIQDQLKIAGNSAPTIMGLKEIADSLLLTDGNVKNTD